MKILGNLRVSRGIGAQGDHRGCGGPALRAFPGLSEPVCVQERMPNHVVNVLHINGNPDQVRAVRDVLEGVPENERDSPRPVDFSKIVPMPEELDVTSGIEAEIAKDEVEGRPMPDYRKDREYDRALVERCKENIRKHGHPTWYEWSVENWGTKWNAYTQRVIEPGIVEFQTAWGCPLAFLKALAARFPEVEFVVQYADEDLGVNCGTLTFRDGELAAEEHPHGNAAEEFASRLHGR